MLLPPSTATPLLLQLPTQFRGLSTHRSGEATGRLRGLIGAAARADDMRTPPNSNLSCGVSEPILLLLLAVDVRLNKPICIDVLL